MSEQGVILSKTDLEVSQRIDAAVSAVVESKATGFHKAFVQARSIQVIKEILTEEFMKPIKELQNTKMGFLTDKKDGDSYNINVLRDVLMEATFMGLQVTGNHFNIIAARMYVTREGFSYLLLKLGINYDITYKILKIEGGTADVKSNISWLNGNLRKIREVEFTVIVNSGMKTDAILGKAERKAKKWLYCEVTQKEVSDGETEDATYTIVSSETKSEIKSEKNTNIENKTEPEKEDKINEEDKDKKQYASDADQSQLDVYISKAKTKVELKDRWEKVVAKKSDVKFKTDIYDDLLKKLPE